MGKELSLARSEEEGRSMLLAITSSGKPIAAPCLRDQRTEGDNFAKVSEGGETEDTKTKSKGSSKVKRANASAFKKARRRRDNKNRKSHRGDERAHKHARRSAKELGITFPGSYCDELETVPHYWNEIEIVSSGLLLRCVFCSDYVWLPMFLPESLRLDSLIKQYGITEGYCRYLDMHREAKVLLAKMRDLRMLETKVDDKRKFAKMADEILSDKEYDRKEKGGKNNG